MLYLIIDRDDYGNLPNLFAFSNKRDAKKALRRMRKNKNERGESTSELTYYEIKWDSKKSQFIKNINYFGSRFI